MYSVVVLVNYRKKKKKKKKKKIKKKKNISAETRMIIRDKGKAVLH